MISSTRKSIAAKFAVGTPFNPAGKTLVGQLALIALVGLSMALITMSSASVTNAQNPNRARTYSQTDVERLVRDVEQSSKEFQRDFDSWLDRSSLDGQQREDRYNKQVKNLSSALTTLRSNFNRSNDWWLNRRDMQRVLNAATQVNSALNNREAGRSLERQWSRLRRDLNRLADAFNLPQVGSNYSVTQPVYPGPGGNTRNCATGTFRGYTNTGESELSILSNGQATARSLTTNASYSGRCANDILYFDWGSFKLVRDRQGVTTVEIGNEANRTSYRRVSDGQGEYNPGYPEQGGNVGNWAVGTFRGMTSNGESELTIWPNGEATARSLTTNQTFNGSYANGVLTFEWGSFRVVRDGRGIATVEMNNQQNRTSYRRVN